MKVFLNQIFIKIVHNKLLKNGAANSLGWLAVAFITFLATPIQIKLLGIERFGIYSLFLGLAGYYTLLDLGLSQGLIKFISEFNAQSDFKQINEHINSVLCSQFFLGFFGFLIILYFSDRILHVLNVAPEYIDQSRISLILFGLSFFLLMLSSIFGSVLMGLQLYHIRSLFETIINFSLNFGIILILFLGGRLVEISQYSILIAAFSLIGYFFIAKRYVPQWHFRFSAHFTQLKAFYQFSFFLYLSKISWSFSNYYVRYLIGFLLDPTAVAFFIAPARLVNLVGGLLGNAFNVIFPYASELKAKEDHNAIKAINRKGSQIFASISIPAHILLIMFSKPILTVWIGAEFADHAWMILSLLAFSSLLGSLTTIPNLITLGLGYSKIVALFSVLSVLVYFLFVTILTQLFGLIGTPIGMIIGLIPGGFLLIYEIKIVLKDHPISYLSNILKNHILPIFLSILSFVLLIFNNQPSYFVYLAEFILLSTFYFVMLQKNGLKSFIE